MVSGANGSVADALRRGLLADEALLARRFLDGADPDDVVQDALISVAASIGSFQGTGKVTTCQGVAVSGGGDDG